MAELSDGERNALLIAVTVLTVKKGTLLLIDEPGRHLHHSIISPFLKLLFSERSDCAFVVSTHDIDLPLAHQSSRTLLVRNCTYLGSNVQSWEADLLASQLDIDDAIKADILGSRRKLLLIEGTEESLDKPLYNLIFPNVSVVAKGSCRDVEHAVVAIRGSDKLHWLSVFGIIDNDQRTESDLSSLEKKGVYALSVSSVESIYYHPEIQKLAAQRLAKVTGGNVEQRLMEAKNSALTSIQSHVGHLSERVAEKTVRKAIFDKLPRKEDIQNRTSINISVDVASHVSSQSEKLRYLINAKDLTKLIEKYPVHKTNVLEEISKKLGFQNRKQYEKTVRQLLMEDSSALRLVRSLFGSLDTQLNAI